MVIIEEIKTSSAFGNDFIHVEFSLKPTHEALTDYQFDLYRSHDSVSGFKIVAENIPDFQYQDNWVNLYNISVPYYYKVKTTKLDTGEESWSEVKRHLADQDDEIAFYLVYLNRHNAEVVVGNQKLKLLSRKHTGTICPLCQDDIRRRPQTECTTCYNTNYIGGFYPAKDVLIVYNNPSGHLERFSPANVAEEKTQVQAWSPNYPLIKVNDVLVDEQNLRYIVTNSQPSIKQFFIIRQTIQMQPIPKSSLLYSVPIGGDPNVNTVC